MGWWKVESTTGMPLRNGKSKRSADRCVVLNALPGVDDDKNACLIGDGPLDMIDVAIAKIRPLIPTGVQIPHSEWMQLATKKQVPTSLKSSTKDIKHIVVALWDNVYGCYEDDWDRKPRLAERVVLTNRFVDGLSKMRTGGQNR
jgi:hypothetical protein